MLESSKGKAALVQTNINSVFQSVNITDSKILMHRMKKIISRRAQAPFKNQTMTNYRACLPCAVQPKEHLYGADTKMPFAVKID